MKRTLVFSIALSVATLGFLPAGATDRGLSNSDRAPHHKGHLVGFSVNPETGFVRMLDGGRDVINGMFNVQAVNCTNCSQPCVAPAVRAVEVDLVANTDVAAGYAISALTSANFTVTDVQYSTQAFLSNGSPLTITITGNVLDCDNWFSVFFDMCDIAPAEWGDACSPTDLTALPAYYSQEAAALIQSSSCVPLSEDVPLMTKIVAMGLLQRAIRYHGLYSFHIENYPSDDGDGDRFSPQPTAAPATFRGKDCDDGNSTIHPTLVSGGGQADDGNCNGIWGVDPNTLLLYEDQWCSSHGEEDRSLLVFGSALASGFHMDVDCLLGDFLTCMSNGPDTLYNFPWKSSFTGSDVATSLHLKMRDRNRCAHRQWMNLAVPDEEMVDFVPQISKLAAAPGPAKPSFVVVFFGWNDVCRDSLGQMTMPGPFMDRLLSGLTALDLKLTPGSHVMLMGLPAVSRNIGPIVNEIHPASPDAGAPGAFTYVDLYDYLNCLGANSCPIITSSDPNVRNGATQRALELDAVMSHVAKTYKFTNFTMVFMDSDDVYSGARERMDDAGIDPNRLFLGFDGLHPRLEYSNFIAESLLVILEQRFPGFVGAVNPNNAAIEALFGDQGGH